MKFVLLFLTIMMFKSIKSTLENLCKSQQKKIQEINKQADELEEQYGKTKTKEYYLLGILAFVIFYTVYYTLASLYVGSLLFTVISIIYILRSWKAWSLSVKWMESRDNSLLVSSRFWNVIWLGYMTYLIYFQVINW